MSDLMEDARLDALQKHPDCTHAEVVNGMSWNFQMTWVVQLWRDQDCYLANDPPKYVEEGYPTR